MPSDPLDSAIRLLAQDYEDRSNPTIAAILDGGPGFGAACNAIGMRVARGFLDGELSFAAADWVMNWVWSYMSARLADGCEEIPEPAYSIFAAFDAGEFHRPGDDPSADPVVDYTLPALRDIVSAEQ